MRSSQGALARRAVGYLRPYRRPLSAAGVCAVLEAGLMLVPVIALKVLIDRLRSPHPHFDGLIFPAVAALGAALLGAVVGVASTYLLEVVSEGIVFDLREQVFERLVSQSVGFYGRQRSGDMISRILNDIGAIDNVLAVAALNVVRYGLAVVTTVGLMFVLNWQLAILVLAVAPLVLLPVRGAGRRIGAARLRVQEQLAAVTGYLQETLGVSGAQLMRAYARAEAERGRFSELNRELRRREIAATMSARWFNASLGIIGLAAPALVIVIGGYLVIHDGASLGTILVFASVITARLGSAVQGAASTATSLLGSVPIWKRVFSIIDEQPEVAERPDALALSPSEVRGQLTLRRVSFTYPGQPDPAVRDVSLNIFPGQFVGIVGPTGAGKTTLGALVARLIDPGAGAVRLDGHDLRDLTLQSVGQAVGVVFQDSFLFHTSLAENLRYGRPEATDEELMDAVRAAQLEAVIDRLPERLDTVVGERGYRLSGGEKQRVAIARLILKDPRVLILDEATSHLDMLIEREVQHALEQLFAGRTAVVIAHRLSTLRNADVILVMEHGSVVESGSHAELLEAGGLYARLYGAQAPEGSRR